MPDGKKWVDVRMNIWISAWCSQEPLWTHQPRSIRVLPHRDLDVHHCEDTSTFIFLAFCHWSCSVASSRRQYGFRRSGQLSYCKLSWLVQRFKRQVLEVTNPILWSLCSKQPGIIGGHTVVKHVVCWMLFPCVFNLLDIKNCEFNGLDPVVYFQDHFIIHYEKKIPTNIRGHVTVNVISSFK